MSERNDITLTINGKRHAVRVEPRRTLVDAIREDCDRPARIRSETVSRRWHRCWSRASRQLLFDVVVQADGKGINCRKPARVISQSAWMCLFMELYGFAMVRMLFLHVLITGVLVVQSISQLDDQPIHVLLIVSYWLSRPPGARAAAG